MKKGKSILLLVIISFVMALVVAMTFVRFSVGVKDYYNSALGAVELDYDIEGGYSFVYTLAKDNVDDVENVEDVLDTIAYRLNTLGYESYSVKAIKSATTGVDEYDIKVEVGADTNEYGEDDTATLTSDIEKIFAYGKLKFYGGTSSAPTDELFMGIENPIESCTYEGYSADSGRYLVAIKFTSKAYNELSTAMGDGDYYLKVTIGDEVLSPFDGQSTIKSTYFQNRTVVIQTATEESAKQEVLQVSSGGLPYKYEAIKDQYAVKTNSLLGENVARNCLIAVVAIAVVSVIAFAIKNKGYAFVALLSVLLFVCSMLWLVIAINGIRIAFGGVLGFIISLVITIDGLVVIVKRISEEQENGKRLNPAVKTGFSRSIKPVSNVCAISLIVSVLLFALTNGAIKNFATVLALGSIVSFIVNLVFTKLFTNVILSVNGFKDGFFNLKVNNNEKEA